MALLHDGSAFSGAAGLSWALSRTIVGGMHDAEHVERRVWSPFGLAVRVWLSVRVDMHDARVRSCLFVGLEPSLHDVGARWPLDMWGPGFRTGRNPGKREGVVWPQQ